MIRALWHRLQGRHNSLTLNLDDPGTCDVCGSTLAGPVAYYANHDGSKRWCVTHGALSGGPR